MRWASAVSDRADIDAALDDATAGVAAGLAGGDADVAIVFASPHFASAHASIPDRLRARLPHRVLLGCSAGGVIGAGREVEERPGLALTAAQLPDVEVIPFALDAGALPDADAPPSAWHQALGVPPEPAPHFVLLADPFSFPVEAWLAGLDYAYARSTKIGGLASGGTQPGANVLYAGGHVLRRGAVGLALAGDVHVDTIVAQGCRPIGRPMRITRCERNVLYELDGKAPLDVLQELLGELSEHDRELLSHSLFLGVVMDELVLEPRAGDFLVRNLIGIDPDRGALAVGERLGAGQTVQFHLRDARTSAEDLERMLARFASRPAPAPARGALLFSCLGRGLHLYGEPDHDTGLFREHLGPVPLGGFFCNGEIGPVGGSTRLHGYTSSFGIFRQRRPAVSP